MRMYDGAVTRHHRPLPQEKLTVNPAGDIEEYTMDVEAYLASKYGVLPKPKPPKAVSVVITDAQRRQAQSRRRAAQK